MKFSTIRPVANGNATTSARMQAETASLEKSTQKPSNPSNPSTREVTKKEIPEEKLKDAVQVANDFLKMVDLRFEYKVDQKTKKEIVEVYDQKTGEKIRQFPPEEILNMMEKMYDMLGILVDDRI